MSTRKNKYLSKKKTLKVTKLKLEKVMTDEKISQMEGDFFERKDFKHVITNNCDVYRKHGRKYILLARFRKNVIPQKLCNIAMEELEDFAKKKHDNRGAAGGALDLDKLPRYVNRNQMKKVSKYVIRGYQSLNTGKMVEQIIGNQVSSNIIGYYDKPDRNLRREVHLVD